MPPLRIRETNQFFLEQQVVDRPHITREVYLRRNDLLLKAMKDKNLTHVVIYGDRERFANVEYFSSYDCRFEEGLFIVAADGAKTIVVGNEGMAYSYQIPFEVTRVLYQNFSLQGQPRDTSETLTKIFAKAGIDKASRVGVVGCKYFYPHYTKDPERLFDLPMYIMGELYEAADERNVINFTEAITGLPNGIRMRIHDIVEIAWAEYSATKTANVMLKIMNAMKEGMTELELSRAGEIDFSPVCMYGLVNCGPEHLSLGLRSPDDTKLKLGEVCGLCYGLRGALTSRVGVAARKLEDYSAELRPTLENFYMAYWRAIAAWYETVKAGVAGGEVYKAVMDLIGGPEYGVFLNPGHNTGMDEWTNSPVFKGSTLPIGSGSYMQCDVIASRNSPVQTAICEDTVVVADAALRKEIEKGLPDLYARVTARQKMLRSELGVAIDDSVLPMSNLNAAYFPFLMNPRMVFAKQ